MTEQYQPIADLLSSVRARWRRLVAFRATIRGALAATAALSVVLLVARWLPPAPTALAGLGVIGLGAVVAAVVWAYRPIGHVPSDTRIARFIEERKTDLDDRLVSAVHVTTARGEHAPSGLAASMVLDAARAASLIDPRDIVPSDVLRRAGIQATASVLLFAAAGFVFRETVHESFDALSLALFPSRVVLEVTPGNARVQAGSSLTVEARLVGNRAPVVAQLLRVEGEGDDNWRAAEMRSDASGRFTLSLNALATSFRYRVAAGAVTSKTFAVAVVRAPRVTRIDVEYNYPKAIGLAPRVEEDGGDIYAPAGTDVRVRVHTDLPAASGRLVLAGDKAVALDAGTDGVLTGSLQIVEDNSYRVALADPEGLTSRGDTEYFIRTLEDRPPEVRVVKPASDRRVTLLEEVNIEAEAEDDFGIASLDLVYAVRGGTEKVVPLSIPQRATSATGRYTLYLEDLDVRPGDFVSYYVRARDLARGKRSSEARSDIFFLDVKPFEEEFTMAQSQAAMGGGQSNQQLDDLVAAQKQIIVATWKLDRRSKAANGAKSAEDIKSVARAEGELKTRVEQASSAFRQSTMRDPRRPAAGRGAQPAPGGVAPRAGQTLVEEDDMAAAATAMGTAVTALDALKTAAAMPPEMDALNHLLKAQADVKKRQIQQQQAGGGGGGNRSSEDLSSLFDKELARHQETNYETPQNAAEQKNDQNASALDKIKELARRQDELLKRQQELARAREQMTPEELKRELEKLTREQNDLRQQAEDVAQQMARQQQDQSGQSGQQNQSGQRQSGQQPNQPGQSGQQAQAGQQPGQSAQAGGQGQSGKEMRDVSEEMRGATSDLRRQDADQASARAARALDKLRDLERQMENASPDGRRRALGDLQLEARQLADAERQIASESGRAGQTEAGKDALRRLAGEQERLAERARRVQEGLKQQSAAAAAAGNDGAESRSLKQAAGDAARDLERQRIAERMQQSAEAMRAAAAEPDQKAASSTDSASPSPNGTPQSQDEIARALDRVADRLAAADRSSGDDESRKLSNQLARTQELRDRLGDLSRRLDELGRQDAAQPGGQPGAKPGGEQSAENAQPAASSAPGESGKSGQGQGGSGSGTPDLARLQEELNREMKEVRDLLNQLPPEDATTPRAGRGGTFVGQGMVLSAPGTEAFKQDYAKWEEMKRQVAAALEKAETTLTAKLQERQAKDRLAVGADDAAPAEYQKQVDSYFKALAARKKP